MAFILIVVNDGTGSQESSNYNYEARINERVLMRGKLRGFNRNRPWWCLVAQIVMQQSARFLRKPEQLAVAEAQSTEATWKETP